MSEQALPPPSIVQETIADGRPVVFEVQVRAELAGPEDIEAAEMTLNWFRRAMGK